MSKLYTIICRDRADSKADRMANLASHLAHMDTVLDRVSLAAPLRDEEDGFTGSLLVISAASAADARAFIERDPYFSIGIWERIDIDLLGMAAGAWVGGKPW
jgi:uncharacterized protein YciI